MATNDKFTGEQVLRNVYDTTTNSLNTNATINVGDIEIGAVEIKDATSDNRVIVDATGALKVTGGASSVNAEYISPTDFTVTYTSASTVTLTGLPFTLSTGAQIVYVKVRNSSTNVTNTYVNGANGYGFGHSSGVVTAYLSGSAASIFTSNDMYEMGINGPKKSYDSSLDVAKVINQSPDRLSYVVDSILDTTNITTSTNYYPSSTGMSMDGYKDLSVSGKLIDADGTATLYLQVTNDEDTTNADWVQVFGTDLNSNTVVSSIVCDSTTTTYALSYDNLNYSYIRFVLGLTSTSNTAIIKARRKSL